MQLNTCFLRWTFLLEICVDLSATFSLKICCSKKTYSTLRAVYLKFIKISLNISTTYNQTNLSLITLFLTGIHYFNGVLEDCNQINKIITKISFEIFTWNQMKISLIDIPVYFLGRNYSQYFSSHS